jgi:hypothetical protein
MSALDEQPRPVEPLDYEPPVRRRVPGPPLWIGLAAAFFLSAGSGVISAFYFLAQRMRDEFAMGLGVGIGFFVLGLCLVGLCWMRYRAQ